MLRNSLDEPIPGGARLAYVFGSGLLFIFLSQLITGICLALYYAPSPITAHVSVAYIVKQVAGGAFLRSLHSYGSSAMIVVLLLHFLQTFLYGSYKGKRELLWISGCALSLLVLAMAFTGYLLTWDQSAYAAGSVGTDLVGKIPLVGEWLRLLLRGGATMGALTLSRFYVLHILVIPGMIMALVAGHIVLFRKAGPAGPVNEDPIRPRLRTESFYPKQVLIDMGFVLVVMGVLGMVAHFVPATLGPEADPANTVYVPRPEWYFLPMFQWLKSWEGWSTVIGVAVIPGVLIALAFLLPFMDRGLERRPWRRPIPVGSVFVVLIGLLWLGMSSRLADARNPDVAAQVAQQVRLEDADFYSAFRPFDGSSHSAGGSAVAVDATTAEGKGIFESHGCSGCHGSSGGGGVGPALTHITDQFKSAQLADMLKAPTAKMAAGGMVALTLNGEEMTSLISYLGSLGGAPGIASAAPSDSLVAAVSPHGSPATTTTAKSTSVPAPVATAANDSAKSSTGPPDSAKSTARTPPAVAAKTASAGAPAGASAGSTGGAVKSSAAPGEKIFIDQGCASCHGAAGVGTARAPALTSFGKTMTAAALTAVLKHPTGKMHSGGMPPISISAAQMTALVTYIKQLGAPAGAAPTAAAPTAAAPTAAAPTAAAPTAAAPTAAAPTAAAPTTAPPTTAAPTAATPPRATAKSGGSPQMSALETKGKTIFDAHHCAECHGNAGVGGSVAAHPLAGIGKSFTPAFVANILQHPTSAMKQGGMELVGLGGDELQAIAAYVSHIASPQSSADSSAAPTTGATPRRQPTHIH